MKRVNYLPLVLWRVSWRFLLRHRWQSGLMILGIAVGVAVVVAIDLANESAWRAFALSKEAVLGKATHQIVGSGDEGLNETVYVMLRRQGVIGKMAPVVREYVSSPQLGNRPMELLGIDPFVDGEFRSILGNTNRVPVDQLVRFLTQQGAVLISDELAAENGLDVGDVIEVDIGGYQKYAVIAGLISPQDAIWRRVLQGMIIADISTAQELTGKVGRLDRVDLIIGENDDFLLKRVSAALPPGLRLIKAETGSDTVAQMTAAFRLNLTALSMLALLVGMFLIFNTMTFSVVRRRALFGMLRCQGVTQREIYLMVLAEAFVVGSLGSLLGVGLGVLLGRQTVAMVSQTITDLYYTLTVQAVDVPVESLIKGGVMGIVATILTALIPAVEAASSPAQISLARSVLESKARRVVTWSAAAGVLLILAGYLIFQLPLTDLYSGFGGTFAVVVGFALLSPLAMVIASKVLSPLMGYLLGLTGRMAPRNLVNALSRTAVAVAALMLAVAVAIGMGLMIQSFRSSVVVWLNETLNGDIYISAPTMNATMPAFPVDRRVIARLRSVDGVRDVYLLRTIQVESPSGSIRVNASSNPNLGEERLFLFKRHQDSKMVWQEMQKGAVLVSEPLARRLDVIRADGEIIVKSPNGEIRLPVEGVMYDYTSSEGSIWMSRDFYQRVWGDDTVTAIDIRLEQANQADQKIDEIRSEIGSIQKLVIRSNQGLREDVLEVFDRTFAITGALRLLATIVAFIGVLNSLLLLQIEKQRELGILRALGLTTRQMWRLVMAETGLMGLIAGLLAIPTGAVLTLILIYVINRRSFGWTLQVYMTPEAFLVGLGIALVAALLAGIYPASKYSRMAASEAVRYE
ncbi:MAG: ABC transporter permease [Anaerolineae bacterium]|nr:ABC transporter permease [Anaerolineae bacterium]